MVLLPIFCFLCRLWLNSLSNTVQGWFSQRYEAVTKRQRGQPSFSFLVSHTETSSWSTP